MLNGASHSAPTLRRQRRTGWLRSRCLTCPRAPLSDPLCRPLHGCGSSHLPNKKGASRGCRERSCASSSLKESCAKHGAFPPRAIPSEEPGQWQIFASRNLNSDENIPACDNLSRRSRTLFAFTAHEGMSPFQEFPCLLPNLHLFPRRSHENDRSIANRTRPRRPMTGKASNIPPLFAAAGSRPGENRDLSRFPQ